MSDPRSATANDARVPAIRVRDLAKAFEDGRIPALQGASLEVAPGEFVAIMGPSGCGKSTLLHLVAALDHPDAGTVEIDGENLFAGRNLNRHRARAVGMIFQLHHLLPTLTASENVQVPMFEGNLDSRERRERARELLALVDLGGKEQQLPAKLSGGERQRVAVARALANEPSILLADEPTGSLDSDAGQKILDLIESLQRERGLTVVLVTHDPTVAARADRVVRMLDGRVASHQDPATSVPEPSAVLAGLP